MTASGLYGNRASIAEVRDAVCSFLRELLPEARKVNVNRLVQIDSTAGDWEAEAEVWQPNAMIQSLGLPTQHPVLDLAVYAVRVDSQLNIMGYETRS